MAAEVHKDLGRRPVGSCPSGGSGRTGPCQDGPRLVRRRRLDGCGVEVGGGPGLQEGEPGESRGWWSPHARR
eukprot:6318023-Pyramimonas_sp.AAC.2